jgi:hypothetical protein
MLRRLIALSVVALAGLFAGCATQNQTSAALEKQAMLMCPSCKTVWVREEANHGPKITAFRTKESMACPDCDAMAKSQLLGDGKVKLHHCEMCKTTPQPAAAAPVASISSAH